MDFCWLGFPGGQLGMQGAISEGSKGSEPVEGRGGEKRAGQREEVS